MLKTIGVMKTEVGQKQKEKAKFRLLWSFSFSIR
jgi:hypothetical protein